MISTETGFSCPICANRLVPDKKEITCTACGAIFPVIANDIAILMPHPSQAVANALVQYEQQINEYTRNIHALEAAQTAQLRDKQVTDHLLMAYDANRHLFREIKQMLLPLITLEEFLRCMLTNSIPHERYNFNLNYLRRDWSGLPAAEQEINEIVSHIRQALPPDIDTNKPVLFLGAGLARIAVAFCEVFQEIYAVDNSLTMACLFSKLKTTNLNFYDIQLKNVSKTADMAKHITASIHHGNRDANNITYGVANALKLPFPDHFFSAVIACYFSDVTPFASQIKEVGRVMAPGGIFLHYGPLEYHHDDVAGMYSFEELKICCQKQGFMLLTEGMHRSTHCKSEANELSKIYMNWIAAFRKQHTIRPVISANSILALKTPLLLKKVIFQKAIEPGPELSIDMVNGKSFVASDFIFDLLLEIDGERTFQQILEILQLEYGEFDLNSVAKVKNILIELIVNGGLQIMNE